MRYRSVGLSKADYFVVPVVELYFYRLLSEDGNMKKQWKKQLADTVRSKGTVRPIKKPTKMNKFHIRIGIPSYYLIWLPAGRFLGHIGRFGVI